MCQCLGTQLTIIQHIPESLGEYSVCMEGSLLVKPFTQIFQESVATDVKCKYTNTENPAIGREHKVLLDQQAV